MRSVLIPGLDTRVHSRAPDPLRTITISRCCTTCHPCLRVRSRGKKKHVLRGLPRGLYEVLSSDVLQYVLTCVSKLSLSLSLSLCITPAAGWVRFKNLAHRLTPWMYYQPFTLKLVQHVCECRVGKSRYPTFAIPVQTVLVLVYLRDLYLVYTWYCTRTVAFLTRGPRPRPRPLCK